MKLLQMIDSLRIGGAEMIAANLAEGFMNSGMACLLCGLGDNGSLAPLLDEKKVPCTHLSTPLGFSPRLMAGIGALFLREKADVAITHHFRQLIHTIPGAVLTRTRVIHVEHDYHFYVKQPHLLPKLGFLLRFAEAFVVVSDEIRDWFRSRLPDVAGKCISIANGVDTARFRRDDTIRATLRRIHSIGEHDVVIGSCARLEPIKNLGFLLDCFAGYLKTVPDAWLVIVGDGSERQALEKRSADLGIADRVIFTGVRYHVEEYLSMFDIYAITSHNEGLPLSVLEAMSSGLPVVAVDVGSLARVICPETGILVSKHEEDEFIEAFKRLSDDRLSTRGIVWSGRRLILKNYSRDQMISQYVRLICPVQQPGQQNVQAAIK
jgi:glycosyltransferase involved in cell wall biosynthesis